MAVTATVRDVLEVLVGVDDPEYPGISIVDLGLVEEVHVDTGSGRVTVDLIPTFLGCPALEHIRADVSAALAAHGWPSSEVRFVATPVWTPARITGHGRAALRDRFTVAVKVGSEQPACPRCGAPSLVETAMFGSMRCRSVARCESCGEALETIR